MHKCLHPNQHIRISVRMSYIMYCFHCNTSPYPRSKSIISSVDCTSITSLTRVFVRMYTFVGFGTWQTVSIRMVDEEEEAILREEEARKEIEDAKQTTGNGSQSKVLSYISNVMC